MKDNTKQFSALMNDLGKKQIPFLFIIDFDMLSSVVLRLDEIDPGKILYLINEKVNTPVFLGKPSDVVFEKHPVGFDEYKIAFDKVFENIKAGNTYLLNLTFPTPIQTNLTMKEIFQFSKAKYKLYYDDKFVVFSPETFVKIIDGKIYSYPMKGTIDAAIENAELIILNDEKETAEHITIVDLIRNDLGIVANNISVEKFRYIDKITTNDKTLLQVSSTISGNLPEKYNQNIGEIIFSLLPAGSITGAPKKKTVEIIKEVEKNKRGYFTGIFGMFDGKNLDSAVMIRFIEKSEGNFVYRSGGGITHLSLAEQEYQEMIDKVYVPII
ncbi:MAG: aminodeoxychorismate synthase component I [bacterium]